MLLRSIYFYLFLCNAIVLYYSPNLNGLESYIAIYGIYLVTILIVIVSQSYNKTNSENRLESLANRITTNGKGLFFLAGLALFNLLIFLLIVPDETVAYLEQSGLSILIFSLLFLFLPLLVLKYTIESHGVAFEKEFWSVYKAKVTGGSEPSSTFSAFILSRILERTQRQTIKEQVSNESSTNYESEEDFVLTAYPASQAEDSKHDTSLESRNALFASEEELAQDNPLEGYSQEIITLFPELEPYTSSKPTNLRPELLLNIIIENTAKDPEIFQIFQKLRI